MGKRKPKPSDANKNGTKPERNNLQDKFANRERNKGEKSRDQVNDDNDKNFDRYYNRNRTGNQNRGGKQGKEFSFSNDWTWYAADRQLENCLGSTKNHENY